jgi:lipoprotein-releasing system ATP-binding protein
MMVVEDVSIAFGKRTILESVSLEVKKKTVTVITGKSGSGKTTLLGIMSGLIKPDSGRVLFEGKNIFRWFDFQRSRFRNKKIGFIFQFFNLLPDLTAFQNIIYPAIINPFSRNIRSDANYLIGYLGLEKIADNYPPTLSGGELQRVAIARSLINRPAMVFADEPTGNLDDGTADDIIRLFAEIRDSYGISFVVVTHEKRFVEIADVHYHIEDGKLVRMNDGKQDKAVVKTKKAAAESKKAAPGKKPVARRAAVKKTPAKKKRG